MSEQKGSQRVVIIGDSAGGGLSLVLLAAAQADAAAGRGLAPTAAVVMSPWTDLALTGPSLQTRAEEDPLVTKEMLAKAGASCLREQDARAPLASPLYGTLKGLPAIQLHVGAREVLLDDTLRYVARARGRRRRERPRLGRHAPRFSVERGKPRCGGRVGQRHGGVLDRQARFLFGKGETNSMKSAPTK